MIKQINEILVANDGTLLSLYEKLYFNVELVNVKYADEEIRVGDSVCRRQGVLETIKELHTQNLELFPIGSVVKLSQ